MNQCHSIYRITHQNQSLIFYGADHSKDPTHSQFTELHSLWEEYSTLKNRDLVALGEIPVPELYPTLNETIIAHGEGGAHYWHAAQYKIQHHCAEPEVSWQRKRLSELFPAEQVAYALAIQNIASWFRDKKDRTFDEMVYFSVNREAAFSDVYGFVFNPTLFNKVHAELFANQLLEDEEFIRSLANPRNEDTVVNKIIRTRTKVRNEYLLNKITGHWRRGESVFVVYGKGHLDVLHNELLKLELKN